MADIANVLKVVKTGKATKTTLAAFDSLNSVLKGADLAAAQIKPHTNDLVDTYVNLISRHADAKKIAEIALRSLGYYSYNTVAVAQLSESQSERILDTIIDVIQTSEQKTACNLAVWCIAIQQLRYAVAKKLPSIISSVAGLIDAANPRFASSTIEYESIAAFGKLLAQIPDLMVKHADTWLPAVYTRLFHENPAVREKAEAVIKIALPLLVKSGIAPSVSSKLVGTLTGGMLDKFNDFLDEESPIQGKDKPTLAIRVWGYLVILLQKELWTSGLIKAFLQIPSTTFNHTDPNVRIVTWNGWRCLMDNCMHDMPHLLRPKSKRTDLLMKPFLSSVEREQNSDVRRALVQSWMHLVAAFGQSLPAVFSVVFFPFLELVAKVPEKEIAEEVLQFIGKLLALPGKHEASDKADDLQPLPLEADWLVDNLALFVLQILPGYLFRTSSAVLDVWQGLVERVASLYSQDPDNKRIASVVSQVVHFLSDLLASGSSLSGDKNASVPLAYSSSVLTRFLQAFSSDSSSRSGKPVASGVRLSPSPHYALLDSSSPSAHASTSTLLGVLLGGLFSNPNAIQDQKQFGETLQVLLSVTPAKKGDQVNPNTSLLTALHVLQRLLESSVARKTNQKVLMLGWISIARSLEERMEETNCAADTPFPFALPNKHDHRTVYYTALLFPLRAALQGDGQSSWTVLVDGTVGEVKKVWNSLYSTFFRISALKDEAEGCVDHLCYLVMEILRPGLRWNNGVGKIIEAAHTMVEVAGPTNAFIAASSRQGAASKNRSKPSDPSALVKLLVRLFKAMSVFPETLAKDEENEHEWMKDKDPATKQLIMNEWQLSLSYLGDTITALFNKARGKPEVLCLISAFGQGIAQWLKDSPVPPEASITLSRHSATSVRSELDKLFGVVAKSVTTNHKPPYDAESLQLLSPLLKEALVTKRKALKSSAIEFWNASFGTMSSLTVPDDLVAVLAKLQGKVPITLPPGWNGDVEVTPSLSTDMASLMFADDDSTHVPTQVFPGFDTGRPKFNRPAAPAAAQAASSSSSSASQEGPRRVAKRRRSSVAPSNTPAESQDEKENDRKYVDIVNSGLAQKKRKTDKEDLVTEHQREVLERQRKEVKAVAFYNGLDQSSQDGSTFNLFTSGSLFVPDDEVAKDKSSGKAKAKAVATAAGAGDALKQKQQREKEQRERKEKERQQQQQKEIEKAKEKEKEKEREQLEKERRELEEREKKERESLNGKENLRLRKRASLNWRKEQLDRLQEKQETKDKSAGDEADDDDDAARTTKRQKVEPKNLPVSHQQPQRQEAEKKDDEQLQTGGAKDAGGLRRMLEEFCQQSKGAADDDFEAQIQSPGELLAGFNMQDLFTAQDKLTRLLSAMTHQLRKLNN